LAGDLYLCSDGTVAEEPSRCDGVSGVLSGHRRERLSRMLSGILRHFPQEYGVEVDERGWARIDDIVSSLRRLRGYSWIQRWHVEAIALFDPKGRFELSGDRIRARYGHSIRVTVEPLGYDAPRTLYHGTSATRVESIMEKGIVRMKRLKVHLTSELDQAFEVGSRHGSPAAIIVDTECLRERGIRVERASRTVYTVDYVPPECIRGVKLPDDAERY